jgi:D-alanyl-D-alanine carboxypeptidase
MIKIKNRKLLPVVIVGLVLVAVVYLAWPAGAKTANRPTHQKKPAANLPAAFDKQQYPVDSASSLWVVVNKGRQLPGNYAPANLVTPSVPLRLSASSPEMHVQADTAQAMESMFGQAKQAGINLMLASGYRSYAEQVSLYNNYAKSYGVAQADNFSARPGHSEHQTGLAADIEPASRHCEVDVCFEDTPEGQWLAANAYQYGFVIRYQKQAQSLTGYQYEPWHIRYVGQPLATQLQASGQTLEQYFGLPAITDYSAQSFELKDQ